MKNFTRWSFLFLCTFFSFLSLYAQNESTVIELKTNLPYGSSITLYPKTSSSTTPIKIDFGDGKIETKTIDPSSSGFFARFDGVVRGEKIKIYAPLTELEASKCQISSIICKDQPTLKKLILNNNLITRQGLQLEGAPNIELLNLSYNQMSSYDFRSFQQLKMLNLSHNEDLGNILLTEGIGIEQIDLSYCDVSTFYPIKLPKLSALNFDHCSLFDLELGTNYPKLSSLNVSHNYIQSLNVSGCPILTQLNCDSNLIEQLDLAFNPELSQLNCSVNKLKTLNLTNNPQLTTISCGNNLLKVLDVSRQNKLSQLNCQNNKIDFLDLSHATFLRRLNASNNLLTFLDFDTNQGQLSYIDIRNNPEMSACALNFMFMTLPEPSRRSFSSNLLIKGCKGATSCDPKQIHVVDEEKTWKLDVRGDGSALCEQINVNIISSKGGSVVFKQSTNNYGQNYQIIEDKVFAGRVIRAEVTPQEGYVFKGIKINGKLFSHNQFIVTENPTTIEAIFEAPSVLTLRADAGRDLSLAFMSTEGKEDISIDWGDGQFTPYRVSSHQLSRIEHKAIGKSIKVKGEFKKLLFDSYPGTGTFDNDLRGLVISNQKYLESLELFMNPHLTSINLSDCPNLRTLNVEYCGLSELNLSGLTQLDTLLCGGNRLTTINIEHLNSLKVLGVKNNLLSTLNVSHQPLLQILDVSSNQLTTISGLSKLHELRTLKAGENKLTRLDLSNNPLLIGLQVSKNQLSYLDLSHQTELVTLYVNGNKLRDLNLSANTKLGYVNCADNGMDACQLNSFYFHLPVCQRIENSQLKYDLIVKEATDKQENQVNTAESLMATSKLWRINYTGDGSGCPLAYIDIYPTEHGTVSFTPNENPVQKGSLVLLNITPDAGYKIASVMVNGIGIDYHQVFSVDQYTIVEVTFSKTDGIPAIDSKTNSNYFDILQQGLQVHNDVKYITIYDATGKTHYSSSIHGEKNIALAQGTYIIRLVLSTGETLVRKISIG